VLPPRRLAPPPQILTVADARAHLGLEETDRDAIIQRCISSAVSLLDGWTGLLTRCIGEQTWASYHSSFPADGVLWLPMNGAASINSVTYRDAAGAEQTLAPASYRLQEHARGSRLARPTSVTWPSTEGRADAVTVVAVYGWPASEVPPDIIEALLLLTAHYFENRSAAAFGGGYGHLPMGVDAIVERWRNPWMPT
jgi:uncharacterized phiE125 gp8 family phage protein